MDDLVEKEYRPPEGWDRYKDRRKYMGSYRKLGRLMGEAVALYQGGQPDEQFIKMFQAYIREKDTFKGQPVRLEEFLKGIKEGLAAAKAGG